MNHRNRSKQRFEIVEYEPLLIEKNELSEAAGQSLWQQFDNQRGILQLRFPSPITQHQWSINSLGWVGMITNQDVEILLTPRFKLQNLFALWTYVYGFEKSPLREELAHVDTLKQFQQHLAGWLASGVIRCAQSGFAKAYQNKTESLSYVRGRILQYRPEKTAVFCQYDQLTTNIPDNQILAYTLSLLSRTSGFDPDVQQLIRKATHLIKQVADPVPFTADEINGRFYHLNNQNYALLHQLCRFFIEQHSPAHAFGDSTFSTFLIHMPTLFEGFVAKWLAQNLPPAWGIKIQERIPLASDASFVFQIDIVLYNKREGTPLAVVDTKYKTGAKISSSDIHQIIAYAKVKSSPNAILIFPLLEETTLDLSIDDIRLQALHFDLNENLEQAGQRLISQIFNKSSHD